MDNSTAIDSRSNMSPIRRQLSPLKQRTPSRRVSIKSPRKSPATERRSFQCEAVSFTPKRTQQPPRAWERRPATPFVPRDEKQKIWKRVPLGELGVDGNRPSGLSRRVNEGTKEYIRVVKKMKVGHEDDDDDSDEDKENLVVAVGSKVVQDDDFCDHSKKKRIVSTDDSSDAGAARDGCDSEQGLELNAQPVALGKPDDMNNRYEGKESPSNLCLEAERESPQSNQPSVEPDVELSDHTQGKASTLEAQELPMQNGDQARHSEDLETSDEGAAHDQRSSSPPTILADNIMVDELAAKQSVEANQKEQAPTAAEQNFSIGQDGSRRISDGEASFLRAFMDRAMSEKIARDRAPEPSIENEEIGVEQGASDLPRQQHDDGTQETEEEAEPNSPLRRSKRSLVTSIPRLQAVPNIIQLKRASGNEFIFNANKATSAINISATTRANTKKNKGSALNVSVRLEQLTSQKEDEERAGAEPSIRTGTKRRQENGGDPSKVRKVLRWNEENLVAFREADPIMNDETDEIEEIEDSSQEGAPVVRSDDDLNKSIKLKLTVSPGTANKAEKAAVKPTGLRRVRRGVTGSLNGTPARTTRARRFEEASAVEDTEEETTSIVDAKTAGPLSAVTASKVQSDSRRSRMPIPKKTGLDSTRSKAATFSSKEQGSGDHQLGRRSLRTRQ